MSAGITYEGDLRPKEPLQDGIFKGVKFWVSHRVPQRPKYVQTIKNNGGKTVENEKTADYMIADPLHRDVPPGSYSYKLIDESIKKGAFQDPEEYLCQTRHPRLAGLAGPQKGTRTPFTEDDDLILRRWVATNQRQGGSLSGNLIYQKLAEKYPRHTWNSWRDRWVKKLSHLPPPEFPDAELSPPPDEQTAEPPARPSTPPPRLPKVTGTGRTPAQNTHSPRSRTKFSQEDDNILLQHIQECVRHNRPLSGQLIFRDLAKDFPQHTEQSWRDRWIRHLKPNYEDKLAQWQSRESSEESDTTGTAEQQQVLPTRKDANVSPIGFEADKPPAPQISNTPNRNAARDVAKMALAVGAKDQNNSQEHRSPTGVQERPQPQAHIPENASIGFSQSPPGGQSMRRQFQADYQAYLDVSGHPFVPFHTIRGRTFELWNLWQAIASQKMVPEERDWQQIAEKLGFNWVQHETIHDELRECYEKHLAEFEDFIGDFSPQSEDSEDGDEEEEEEREESQSQEAPLPSSPPIMPSLKRSFDSSGHAYPQSSPKRRRVDRNGEVPSTPDHVNGTSRLRRQTEVDTTPSKLADQRVIADDAAEDESQDTVRDLPSLPRERKKVVEPETQDFRFDPETQNIMFETEEGADAGIESQYNITPSQQLHQESDAIVTDVRDASPTPKTGVQNTDPLTPTPRRSRRIPFRQDSDDEIPGPATTNGRRDVPASNASTGKAKRRSLPKSFAQKSSPVAGTSASASRRQAQSPLPERAPSVRRSTPAQETPEDVIDRFCSLGYPRNMVLQALRATTWRLGDAGQVMEMLKQGQELPQRTHGVWTQRDDDALKLVTSGEPARDEKEERKRARARKRLEEKHGAELMELRRKYLWDAV
ncbi:hypothetical protein Hte_002447 [Hypoxylon texense]